MEKSTEKSINSSMLSQEEQVQERRTLPHDIHELQVHFDQLEEKLESKLSSQLNSLYQRLSHTETKIQDFSNESLQSKLEILDVIALQHGSVKREIIDVLDSITDFFSFEELEDDYSLLLSARKAKNLLSSAQNKLHKATITIDTLSQQWNRLTQELRQDTR